MLCSSLVCVTCSVCHGLFALPLGLIGWLCSVTVALPGHLLYTICLNYLHLGGALCKRVFKHMRTTKAQISLRIRKLRKHAYSNILKISPPKNGKFSDKNSVIFHVSAQDVDCMYSLEPPQRGGSNEYPQSIF